MNSIRNKKLKNWKWPQNRWSKIEFACPDNVGHGFDVHGCDGCCGHESFVRIAGSRYREMVLTMAHLDNFEKMKILKKWGLENEKKTKKKKKTKKN